MLLEFSKALSTGLRIAGRLLGFARRIPIIDEAVDRARSALLNPVVIKLIRRSDDPGLDSALDLYRRRIPDDQRFDPADIVRWIREDERSRAAKGPSDWFLIAKFRRQVRGFVLFHYYPANHLALFA
jgi:hypothetical protein